jgi:Dictyostelium (slime mold) repeat
VYYVDTPANRASLPLPSPWASASSKAVTFKNALSPGGPTPVKTAVVKIGKSANVLSKGVGGLAITSAPGPNGVITILTLKNLDDLGAVHKLCTQYATGLGSTVEQSTTKVGNKLVLKKGVAITCPTCTDGTLNGTETGVDCGGDDCAPCASGSGCLQGSDCVSSLCASGICQPSCIIDGVVYPALAMNDNCGMCDPSVGNTWVPAPDRTSCVLDTAGNKCIVPPFQCVAGACVGAPLDCAATAPTCTVNSCDPNQGCQTTPLTCPAVPDDASSCYRTNCDPIRDLCVQECAFGTTCNDGGVAPCSNTPGCVPGVCGTEIGPMGQTVHRCTNDATKACNNDDDCNQCNDNNPCTQDVCDPLRGICSSIPVSCDDHDVCTSDFCDAVLGCQHIPAPQLGSDLIACTEDTCGSGTPTHTPRDNWCDDGDPCTVDYCEAGGVCRVSCSDHVGGCGELGVGWTCLPDGFCSKSCTSAADCAPEGTCTNNVCVQSCGGNGDCLQAAGFTCQPPPVPCAENPKGVCNLLDPNDPCRPGSCDSGPASLADVTTGCMHVNACDDGDPCTTDLCAVKPGGGISCSHVALNCSAF